MIIEQRGTQCVLCNVAGYGQMRSQDMVEDTMTAENARQMCGHGMGKAGYGYGYGA